MRIHRHVLLLLGLPCVAIFSAGANSQEYPGGSPNLSHMTMGYTYYNRNGATVSEHNADLKICLIEAQKTISFDELIDGHHGPMGLVGDLIADGMQAASKRGSTASALENCMVVLGWRVILLPQTEGKEIAGLPPADAATRITPWIGASEPHGQIYRSWSNDGQDGRIGRWSYPQPHLNDGLLALKLLGVSNLKMAKNSPDPVAVAEQRSKPSASPRPEPNWPNDRLGKAQLTNLPAEAALLIMGKHGGWSSRGKGLILERVGATPGQRPGVVDGRPDAIWIHGIMDIYAIPPGKWRAKVLGSSGSAIDLCLGSPFFEAKPGEVLFGGNLDFGGPVLGPDMALTPAKAILAGSDFAARLKPVEWTNGSRGDCGGQTIYALEFPNAPFEQGYAWGSRFGKKQ